MLPDRRHDFIDLPEPLGAHAAPGFKPAEIDRARHVGLSRLTPTETTVWSYTRPRVRSDLWRAARQGIIIAGSLFGALSVIGTQDLTLRTMAIVAVLALLALISTCMLWKSIRSAPCNLIPGFVAILTKQRILVVNLDTPHETWSLAIGQVLQVSSDTLLNQHGGVWVSGWWLDPRGRRIETKVPLFIGRETAATVQMLRRRLTAVCLDMPDEAAA